ncbi:MAG TPA: response regulator [Gemmatimonadales bacterium]|nr:response regulator [Gemmatimonadales bacterium]HZH41083.1 response regulator [Gemmatimonadales bacterium]
MSRADITPSPPVRHLLVVDDEPHIGLLLRPEFEARGFRVSVARSLAAARAVVDSVDVMLLDLHLPDGSGMEFLREVRRRPRTAALPILILTGEAGDRILEDAQRLGAGFLTKPFSPTKLAARVTALVEGAAPVAGDTP